MGSWNSFLSWVHKLECTGCCVLQSIIERTVRFTVALGLIWLLKALLGHWRHPKASLTEGMHAPFTRLFPQTPQSTLSKSVVLSHRLLREQCPFNCVLWYLFSLPCTPNLLRFADHSQPFLRKEHPALDLRAPNCNVLVWCLFSGPWSLGSWWIFLAQCQSLNQSCHLSCPSYYPIHSPSLTYINAFRMFQIYDGAKVIQTC